MPLTAVIFGQGSKLIRPNSLFATVSCLFQSKDFLKVVHAASGISALTSARVYCIAPSLRP
jgi:hypothetical protein